MSVFLNKFTASRKFILVLGLIFLTLPLGSVSAQTQGGEGGAAKAFKDWYLRCASAQDGTERCALFQDVINQNDQQPLMQLAVTIVNTGEGEQRLLIVTVRVDVALRTGIHMQIDEADIGTAPFFSCAPAGCQARIPLQDELLKRLKAGNGGRMTYRNSGGLELPIPFSLQGFTAGVAEVR